jgi:hypothetical protein
MAIQWNRITPAELEAITLAFVGALGFQGARLRGGVGDGGVDVEAFLHPLSGAPVPRERWIFQCKHQKRISRGALLDEMAGFVGAGISAWVLICPYQQTASFTQWFERLGRTPEFKFRIMMWTGPELDQLITRQSDAIMDSLGPRIATRLGLNGGGPGTTAFRDLVAACRDHTNKQISRFATHKYIPGLYVDRAVSSDLDRFSFNELETAQRAQEHINAALQWASASFAAGLDQAKTLAMGASGRRRPRRARRRRRSRPRDENQELKVFEAAMAASKVWLNTAREGLENARTAAQLLPSRRYVGRLVDYADVANVVHALERHLRAMPRYSVGPKERVVENTAGKGVISNAALSACVQHLGDAEQRLRKMGKHGLLLIDRAGGGKTNLLCHFASTRATQLPVLLLFGKDPSAMALKDQVLAVVAEALAVDMTDAAHELDRALRPSGQFLIVCIDGINEARNTSGFDAAIASFLQWAAEHRLKTVLTCRDIYWEYFNRSNWSSLLDREITGSLREFKAGEYDAALPLYLRHFRIQCDLSEEARRACQHPLLLRFFCESYGNPDGEVNALGLVRDIRLKELFDTYIRNKARQVGWSLEHRDEQGVIEYLYRLVRFMFTQGVTSVTSSDIGRITGDADLTTAQSLYVRLLDEDIILEERPAGPMDARRVSFVYEEFMEYLVAGSLVAEARGGEDADRVFETLNASLENWVNGRGAAEYVALLLLSADGPNARSQAVRFLMRLATGSPVWKRAFWSVIGKSSGYALGGDVLDLFAPALNQDVGRSVLEATLAALRRFGNQDATRIAGVILYTASLPHGMTWSELEGLTKGSTAALTSCVERLGPLLREGRRFPAASPIGPRELVDLAKSYMDLEGAAAAERAMYALRRPIQHGAGGALIGVLWKAYPDFHLMLVNGLISDIADIRFVSGDRLGFVKEHGEIARQLCAALADAAPTCDVSSYLRQAAMVRYRKGKGS